MTIDPAIDAVARTALAGLLAAAALHKLRAPAAFRAALEAYALLPRPLVTAAAAGFPAAEVAIAVALLLSPARPWAAAAAAALLAIYSAAIALNLGRGRRDLDCGCFGPARRQPIGGGLVARNAVWIAVALAACLPLGARPLAAADALSIAGGLAAAALLHAASSQLLATAPRLRAAGAAR